MKKSKSTISDFFQGINLGHASVCLKALAHPTRLRLVGILLKERISVGDLAVKLRLAQPRVSGHVRILESRGMLVSEREGSHTYYRVANPALVEICSCIRTHFALCPLPTPPRKKK